MAGVIGWPISHSLGPHVHGFWLNAHNIYGDYFAESVKPEDLKSFFQTFAKRGWKGTNITIPHKTMAMNYIDEIDDSARKIGAINTVVVKEDGSLRGFNTDGYGFIKNLQDYAPQFLIESGPAVVLGAGGASRAILISLLQHNAPEVRLANRDNYKAIKCISIFLL